MDRGDADGGGLRVERVAVDVVRPLRQKVLRPHQTVEEMVFAGDDATETAHFAAYRAAAAGAAGDQPIGIASITPEAHPRDPAPGDWRIRGMATDPEAGRSVGAGALLLGACVEWARAHGGARVWCNARTSAAGFYAREGFAAEGEEFEIAGIGPHFLMALPLG